MRALLLMLVCASTMGAQSIEGLPRAAANKGHVTYAAELVHVPAGKPAVVELRFRVEQGFHVNSHVPSSELLIPTVLNVDDANSVKVLSEDYPKGSMFRLMIGEGETLNVYQGEFRVLLHVVAPKGESTLKGSLRYQACDNASCFPPRTLAVNVPLTGK